MNKKMTFSAVALTAVFVLASGLVDAGPRHGGFEDRARVLNAKPIYETVRVPVTEQRCRDRGYRTHYDHRNDSMTGTIAGGILGGIVGNQFGRGDGKVAMTVAGALLGGSIGNDMTSGNRHVHDHGPRCREITRYNEREELVGYRVKYRYNGQTFWTRTANHPGEYLRVRVSVSPVE